MLYAAVGTCYTNDGGSKFRLLGVFDEKIKAQRVAREYNPDWDPKVSCHRMEPWQASPWIGECLAVMDVSDTHPLRDWEILPQGVPEKLKDVPEDEWEQTLEDLGYVVFEDPEEPGRYYTVKHL